MNMKQKCVFVLSSVDKSRIVMKSNIDSGNVTNQHLAVRTGIIRIEIGSYLLE